MCCHRRCVDRTRVSKKSYVYRTEVDVHAHPYLPYGLVHTKLKTTDVVRHAKGKLTMNTKLSPARVSHITMS